MHLLAVHFRFYHKAHTTRSLVIYVFFLHRPSYDHNWFGQPWRNSTTTSSMFYSDINDALWIK